MEPSKGQQEHLKHRGELLWLPAAAINLPGVSRDDGDTWRQTALSHLPGAACRTWGTGNISVWGELRACTHGVRDVRSPHLASEVLNLLGSACRRKGCVPFPVRCQLCGCASHSSCQAGRAAPPLQSALSRRAGTCPVSGALPKPKSSKILVAL